MKKVKVTNVNSKKFKVNSVLTIGKVYDVINETDDYIFIRDNSGKIGGFYKNYFEELK